MEFPSHFIAASHQFAKVYAPCPAPYFRKTFWMDNFALEGKILITTPGFYRLWINGTEITRGYMAPYIANPNENIYYDSYDITPYLRKRDNVIGVLLGNGMQNNWGGFIWWFEKGDWRGAPNFALTCEVQTETHQRILIETDTSWKTAPSPIQWDDERIGECYDARKEIPGWNNFGDDRIDWKNAILVEAPKGTPRLNHATPILTEKRLKPISITLDGDGYIYDFGENYSGITELSIHGNPGQTIEILHGEYLHDGHFYADNLIFPNNSLSKGMPQYVQKIIYTCSGNGLEEYSSSFSYCGFRYAKVIGISKEQATEDLLTFRVMHSAVQSAGGFECSDKDINQLQEMTRRSDLSNFWYFPTDCPHREKNGWTGDAAVSAEQMLMNFHVENDYKQWMENIATSLWEDGTMPGIIPTNNWGYDVGPCWDQAFVIIPYEVYRATGNTDIIKNNADALLLLIRHYEKIIHEGDGLVHRGLADWCSPQHPNPKCDSTFLRTVAVYNMAQKLSFMFKVIHQNEQQEETRLFAQELRNIIRQKCMTPNEGLVNCDGISANSIALYFELFNENENEKAFQVLLDRINNSDGHLDCGMFGIRTIFHVLSAYGQTDLALKLILEPTAPSYGAFIKQGLTTLPESPWGTEEFKHAEQNGQHMAADATQYVSSLNHHFFGDISNWFISVLGGIKINPDKNDENSFIISPEFSELLTHAHAWHDFNAGQVDVIWQKTSNTAIQVKIQQSGQTHGIFKCPKGYTLIDGKTQSIIPCGENLELSLVKTDL